MEWEEARQRPQRGQSPVEHRVTCVCPSVCPSVGPSVCPFPQALTGLISALSDLKSTIAGLKSALSGLESVRAELERTYIRPERVDLWPERADSRPERADFRPERIEYRPERADIRPGRAWGDGQMNRRNKWKFYRTSSPLGPLPKKDSFVSSKLYRWQWFHGFYPSVFL